MHEVYLDYNGSAPLDPRVAEAMIPALESGVGNASSVHRFGQRQAADVADARERVASLVGASPSGVIFCAGATEANNLALIGLAEGTPAERTRIVISAVEHASVREPAQWLHEQGKAKVDVVGVTQGGFVDLDELDSLLGSDVLAVSVMAANSETGVLNPLAEVAERAASVGAVFHCDATQLVGRLPLSMDETAIDLISMSSHKICGPGGVGALLGTRHSIARLRPVTHGGGHERGLRSGSLNVAGIVGLGAAAELVAKERDAESARVEDLRDRLIDGLNTQLSGVRENGDATLRLPNTASVRFKGADAEAVVFNMDPVAISTGSACSSGSIEPSHVLLAMGLSRDEAFESVRFSLGRFTTEEEIETAVQQAVNSVEYVREMNEGDN
ncbi:cysteine desulfurase family protein [Candidatus Poriferisocius sp.]|uniref:cysteine desulfurase family protein n=1 Tax=Candidatus Poriferisocius sp. TaxID=3101276 RepID=UPI003B5AE710